MCGKRCSFYSCTTLVLTFRRLIFINFFHSVQYSDLITTKIWNNFHPQLNFDGFNTAHDVTLKCQCSQIFGIISVLFGQWVISCIYDISSFVEGTTIPATSTVGTAVSVNFLFMPREVDTLTFIVNDDCSKCAEQRTYEREGVKCGRCVRTNRTHFFLLSGAFSSSGSVCIDIPSVCWLFVQLAWLGSCSNTVFTSAWLRCATRATRHVDMSSCLWRHNTRRMAAGKVRIELGKYWYFKQP